MHQVKIDLVPPFVIHTCWLGPSVFWLQAMGYLAHAFQASRCGQNPSILRSFNSHTRPSYVHSVRTPHLCYVHAVSVVHTIPAGSIHLGTVPNRLRVGWLFGSQWVHASLLCCDSCAIHSCFKYLPYGHSNIAFLSCIFSWTRAKCTGIIWLNQDWASRTQDDV